MQVDESKTSSSGLEFKLHPLVLINISDHHTRTKANTPGAEAASYVKVLGILLGTQSGRTVDIVNSFEIKYEMLPSGIPQIDQPFLIHKQEQYKQVFPKQDVVGWYTTGEELSAADVEINKVIMTINESPVFLLLNPRVDHTRKDLPVTLYETELHVVEDMPQQIFVKSNYTVESSDAERIGLDQVAKILPSGTASGSEQLTSHLTSMHSAVKMLNARVGLIQQLVAKTKSGEIPFDHALMRKVASLVSSLPAMDTTQFKTSYQTEYNDTLLTIYLSSMTKGVASVQDLVDKVMVAYDASARRRRGAGF